jgi:hypothetical protein
MAKVSFEMPWNYSEEEYSSFLKEKELKHLKNNHNSCYFKAGDALKNKQGVIVRIMSKMNNYENCSHDYFVSNNKLSKSEMYDHFGFI